MNQPGKVRRVPVDQAKFTSTMVIEGLRKGLNSICLGSHHFACPL